MPQAAWEALLRDAVHGLRPPYTPQALRQWLQATHPQGLGRRRPLSSPPLPPPPHQEGAGQGQGKGKGHQGGLRQEGTEALTGTGRRKRHHMGARNHPRTRKGRERGPKHGRKGHHGRRHDPHPGRAGHDGGTSAAPPPPNTPRHRGTHPPTHTTEASIGRRADHTSAHPPATGNRTEKGGHTYTGRTGHTHRGSRR